MATWGPIQLRLKGSRQVEFAGEASPAPGGGSMTIEHIFTAAEIAARYDVDSDSAAVEWPTSLAGIYLQGAFESDVLGAGTDGLDAGDFYNLAVYPPGADTPTVVASADQLPTVGVNSGASGMVSLSDNNSAGPLKSFGVALASTVYAVFGGFGGSPPTTGQLTIRLLPW